MFADLVGSTELGAQDPERTRLVLERFYDAMADEIVGAGGTVEKFAGDAVMAAFGAPTAHEDDAERALHAALGMLRRLEGFDGLALRIGVNTGEVVVGRARQGSSFVTGDAVNVAARLEQAAVPGAVLVGERTVAVARGAFEFGEPIVVEAKGKPGGITCRPLFRSLSPARPRGVIGLGRAFVGRERELELLQATYRRVAEYGDPHLVTIMGVAGVGKTRLVRELWEWLAVQQPAPLRPTGRCIPYGRGITFRPLADIVRQQFGILESDPPVVVLSRLGHDDDLAMTLGFEPPAGMHPLEARDRLHGAWVAFFERLAKAGPVVVLIEDLHWAEPALLDLVEQIVGEVQGPLLLIATARPELLEDRPAWGGGRRNGSLVWLDALSGADTRRLVDELLMAGLPAELSDLILERAEGNPFFVEELLATLMDQGVLERTNAGWRAVRATAGIDVPDSVQAVLAARMDLLDSPAKRALQAAAVVGRVFWAGPVRHMMDGVEPDFAMLEQRDFIRRRAGSSMARDHEYVFKHALTREVAYASLSKATRARLHASFAELLEQSAEGADERAPLLAFHYGEAVIAEDVDIAWLDDAARVAELRARAVSWSRRAAESAISRYEIDEGVAVLERAVAMEPSPGARSGLWHEIARAHFLHFDGERFWQAMQQAIELCDRSADAAELTSELAFVTAARAGMWNPLPDPTLVAGWIDRALALAPPDSVAHARTLVARALWQPREATDDSMEAWRLTEGLDDPVLRSYALEALSYGALVRDRYAESSAWSERRMALLPEIGDPDHRADIYRSPISGYVGSGRIRRREGGRARPRCDRLRAHGPSSAPRRRVPARDRGACGRVEGRCGPRGRG